MDMMNYLFSLNKGSYLEMLDWYMKGIGIGVGIGQLSSSQKAAKAPASASIDAYVS
jgi:hypothetical protein